MNEFLSMGGYAVYVWPSYGLFLLAVLGGWGTAAWRGRQIRLAIRSLYANSNQQDNNQ